MGAYVLLSLLTGARTEELRALTWTHVDLDGSPHADPPSPPHIMVWRSVRAGGDTKTRKSRRTLALPAAASRRCIEHRDRQARPGAPQENAGRQRSRLRLRSRHAPGRGQRPSRVPPDRGRGRARRRRLDTSRATAQLRLPALRQRVPIEQIARLVGHTGGSAVTETVYRKQLRPVIDDGAATMNELFPRSDSHSVSHSAD